jgi:hypothetical protein
MRNVVAVVAGVVVVVALSACGGLVPAIPVDDLFGLDGQQVDLAAAPVVLAEGDSTVFTGTVNGQIESDGIELPSFVLGAVNARRLSERITIAAELELRSLPNGLQPEQFTIVAASLALDVKHNGTIIASPSASITVGAGVVVNTSGECQIAGDELVCPYAVTLDPATQSLELELTGQQAAALFDVIKSGGTLDVEGSYTLTLAEPGIAGSKTLRVTLVSLGGAIEF